MIYGKVWDPSMYNPGFFFNINVVSNAGECQLPFGPPAFAKLVRIGFAFFQIRGIAFPFCLYSVAPRRL